MKKVTIKGQDAQRLRNALGIDSECRFTAREIVVRCEMMRQAVAQAADKELISLPTGMGFSVKPNEGRTR